MRVKTKLKKCRLKLFRIFIADKNLQNLTQKENKQKQVVKRMGDCLLRTINPAFFLEFVFIKLKTNLFCPLTFSLFQIFNFLVLAYILINITKIDGLILYLLTFNKQNFVTDTYR